jgi:uncharacterized protein (TIGR02271 family)
MADTVNPQSLMDAEVYDPAGEKIGKVGEVYLREDSHQPAWITVKSGLFNQKETMVPLQGARMGSDGVRVGVTKERIKDAPPVDAEGRLSERDSAALYQHYGIQPEVPTSRGPIDSPRPGSAPKPGGKPSPGGAPKPSGGPNRRDTEVVRSEERLSVGKEEVESGRVRLRKYVVTEQEQITVPVSHEEVRIEREPITGADRAARGKRGGTQPQLGEAEEEIVLHEERPVVHTEAVPVERIRVGKETVTEDRTVGGEVRKERVEFDEPTTRKPRPKN